MKTGLILVDIQNDYFAGGRMELRGMDAASAKAKELLDFGEKKVLAEDVHASFMAALGAAYAKVMSCNEFIANIEK